MRETSGTLSPAMVMGIVAGLTGTAVMMAMRLFDERYAPMTIAKTKEDPGAFVIHAAERATGFAGTIPRSVENSVTLAIHAGHGTLFGVLYGLWRGQRKNRSALTDGVVLGTVAYAAGQLGLLPAFGLSKSVWKQEFPEIAGELLRHVAYGVATTAAYGFIETM